MGHDGREAGLIDRDRPLLGTGDRVKPREGRGDLLRKRKGGARRKVKVWCRPETGYDTGREFPHETECD